MKKILPFFYFLFTITILNAQNPEWNNYLNGQTIQALAIEGDNVWVGTTSGLVKLSKSNGDLTYYTKANSGLPDNNLTSIVIDGSGNKWIGTQYGGLAKFDGTNWAVYKSSNSALPYDWVYSIAIDGSGNKWIGTPSGLARFDGTNWTIYNSSNSELPDNSVNSIAIDGSGNKWIGTQYGGLAKFDGINWTVYNMYNSGLPSNWVTSIAIDSSGNKWCGTWSGGLAKYDGTNWKVYNISNSGLPYNQVTTIAIDGSGNKWIGTGNGLAKFDGTTWEVFKSSNSNLPSSGVLSLAIDGSGNMWIGTSGGIGIYKEGGVVLSLEEAQKDDRSEIIGLFPNYPNPFQSSTTIKYKVTEPGFVSLMIFDVLGTEVATLVNEKKPVGEFTIELNAAGLSDGIYFCRLQAGLISETRKLILRK